MLKYFRNRKTLGYLVGTILLGLVIVAFIVLYIPDFMGPAAGVSLSDEVARVEGISISAQQFLQRYRMQEQMYRTQLGDRYSPALMRQLGIENLVLQGLIQDALIVVEAEHQGLRVSDEELDERILQEPGFQANGRYIGREAVVNLLARSGMSPQQFTEQLRRDLLRDKLRQMLSDGIIVGSAEVEKEYRRRNEKVNLEYIVVPKAELVEEVEVSDEEVSDYFEKNQERYRLPVQRKVSYMMLTRESFVSAVTVTDREIERYFNQNLPLYETPEQIGASHILFKTGEDDEAEVLVRAEQVLARVKAGDDFAELAREFSEDTSAEQGGDLGLFSPGEMVPEFDQAAFSLEEGEVSELVRTTYGYHIIKVTQQLEPIVRPLKNVSDEIRNLLTQEKAGTLLEAAVDSASALLGRMESLEALAQQYPSLKPQETPFFGRQDPLPQLGGTPETSRLAFELDLGRVSPPLRVGSNYAFFQVLEEEPTHIPPFEEVTERVRTDLVGEKAMDLARSRAEEIREKLNNQRDAAVAVKAEGIELQTTESFLRGTELPEAGRAPSVQQAAFSLDPGSFSAPLPSANGYVVLRILERTGYSAEQFMLEKGPFHDQFLNEKRQQAWTAFLQELERRYTVQWDREVLRRITG